MPVLRANDTTMNQPPPAVKPRPASRGFSLASLFVLVTASAVVIAGAAPLMRDVNSRELDLRSLPLSMLAGLAAGLVLGVLLGLHQFRIARGVGFGAAVGMTLGILAGPMSLLKPKDVPGVGLAMFVGSLLIVGIAALARSRSTAAKQ